jgi:trehalose 6-phosphate phosphatase
VREWLPALRRDLCRFESLSIEDKGASLAIHYRHAADRRKAVEAIREAAAALADVRVVQGKQVVNLLPAGAPNKGAALERLRVQLGCELALYVGDDTSDEDAFAKGSQVIGVRVGHSSTSAARYFLRRQRDVDILLERLVGLRRRARRLHGSEGLSFGRRRGPRER